MIQTAYIYDAIRTPRGKGKSGGSLNQATPIWLVRTLLNAMQDIGADTIMTLESFSRQVVDAFAAKSLTVMPQHGRLVLMYKLDETWFIVNSKKLTVKSPYKGLFSIFDKILWGHFFNSYQAQLVLDNPNIDNVI